MTVARAFDAIATGYDEARRRLVPCFDGFYGAVLELVAESQPPATARVLDLGAGTGLLAAMIRAAHPGALVTLIDAAPAMLDEARRRFAGAAAVEYLVADYAKQPPTGPFDLVVSALSIHHLEDPAKRRLFTAMHAALVPGGLFINADQILAPTPGLEARAHARWREQAAALGSDPQEIAAAESRMAHDRCATLESQLAWLREAGFVDVDCAFKSWRFVVYSGVKRA